MSSCGGHKHLHRLDARVVLVPFNFVYVRDVFPILFFNLNLGSRVWGNTFFWLMVKLWKFMCWDSVF